MDQKMIAYLTLSVVMMCWALYMCISIRMSGGEISTGETIYILVLTFLFWWVLVPVATFYLIGKQKFMPKRKY